MFEISAGQRRSGGGHHPEGQGKGAVLSKQIDALTAIHTPSVAQIEQARRVIAAFQSLVTYLVVINGKLIEKPFLREMHRIVAKADGMHL